MSQTPLSPSLWAWVGAVVGPCPIPVFCCVTQMASGPSSLHSRPPSPSFQKIPGLTRERGSQPSCRLCCPPTLLSRVSLESLKELATCLADSTHILCFWSLGFYSCCLMGLFAARLPSFPEGSFPGGSVSNTVWSCHSLTQTSGYLPHKGRLMRVISNICFRTV